MISLFWPLSNTCGRGYKLAIGHLNPWNVSFWMIHDSILCNNEKNLNWHLKLYFYPADNFFCTVYLEVFAGPDNSGAGIGGPRVHLPLLKRGVHGPHILQASFTSAWQKQTFGNTCFRQRTCNSYLAFWLPSPSSRRLRILQGEEQKST